MSSLFTRDQLEAISWLGVAGVGSQTLSKIATYLQSRRCSWPKSWQLLAELKERQILNQRQFEQATLYKEKKWPIQQLEAKLTEAQVFMVDRTSANYPRWLAQSSAPPYVLFCQGSKKVLTALHTQPVVAVVGTRKMTPYGKLATTTIVEELVTAETIIVSGAMYGVDAAAHAAALACQGTTIAVLASGLARTGSYWQQALCQQILDGQGLLVSEFWPWSASQKKHFPIRNRVVAGLAQAVVVTEAAEKSGSLITAQYAVDYNREVCAVPGPITSEFSQGTKWLINEGATLVGSGREVLATFDARFQLSDEKKQDQIATAATMDQPADPPTKVCHFLHQTGSGTTSQLANHVQLSLTELLPILSKLELQGRICSVASRWHLAS